MVEAIAIRLEAITTSSKKLLVAKGHELGVSFWLDLLD